MPNSLRQMDIHLIGCWKEVIEAKRGLMKTKVNRTTSLIRQKRCPSKGGLLIELLIVVAIPGAPLQSKSM
jgi:hypothetical protein